MYLLQRRSRPVLLIFSPPTFLLYVFLYRRLKYRDSVHFCGTDILGRQSFPQPISALNLQLKENSVDTEVGGTEVLVRFLGFFSLKTAKLFWQESHLLTSFSLGKCTEHQILNFDKCWTQHSFMTGRELDGTEGCVAIWRHNTITKLSKPHIQR